MASWYDQIQDSDLLACTDVDGKTHKVTGLQFKEMILSDDESWEEPRE